jgi:hypothetical protein
LTRARGPSDTVSTRGGESAAARVRSHIGGIDSLVNVREKS